MARLAASLFALALLAADGATTSAVTELAKLTAADGASGDNFGRSVAISSDGSRVAVGAPHEDDKGSNSGSVYLFDGAGEQLTKLTASDVAAYDNFGTSVAISSDGSRVAVGAPYAGNGSVYLFDGAGEQLAKLTASDGASDDYFGGLVAISSDGSRVAVGAYYDDDKGSDSGSVYLFDGAGEQLAKLTASGGAAYDWFGTSVAISSDGSRVAVGAYYDDSAYLFDEAGAQLAKLTASDGAADDYFGRSVAISSDGSRVAVGAPYAGNGSVYLFGAPTSAATWAPTSSPTLAPASSPTPSPSPSAEPTTGGEDVSSGARRAGRLLAPLAAAVVAGRPWRR